MYCHKKTGDCPQWYRHFLRQKIRCDMRHSARDLSKNCRMGTPPRSEHPALRCGLLCGRLPRILRSDPRAGCDAALLLSHPVLRGFARLDKPALMNAIWSHHPDYALTHNSREQQGLNDLLGLILNAAGIECELSGSAENMVSLSPEAGTEYVWW